MTSLRNLSAALLIAVLGYAVTSAAPEESEPAGKAELSRPAPDFALKDVYGKTYTLKEFRGRIVVLEWINQDCPVSHKAHESRQMQDAYAKHAEKIVWLAIDSTHNAKPDRNRTYAAKMGLAYPILHDPDGKVGRTYQAKTTPHMFVIDAEGVLVYDGAIDDRGKTNYVTAAIEDLLAGKAVAKPRTQPYGCSVKYAE